MRCDVCGAQLFDSEVKEGSMRRFAQYMATKEIKQAMFCYSCKKELKGA
jgi:hypothetical protein